MLLACLFQSLVYIPVSEIETNNGYIDIYLRRSPLLPEVKYEWIFELKYFKTGETLSDNDRNNAKKQLLNHTDSAIMKDSKD